MYYIIITFWNSSQAANLSFQLLLANWASSEAGNTSLALSSTSSFYNENNTDVRVSYNYIYTRFVYITYKYSTSIHTHAYPHM